MLSLSLYASLAAAASAVAVEPSGKWVVDFAETHCAASRDYPAPGGKIGLGLRPAANGKIVHLLLVREGWASKWAEQAPARLRIGGGPLKKTLILRYGVKNPKGNRVVNQLTLTREEMAALAAAESVEVQGAGADVTLALREMVQIDKLLRDCTTDLQRYWNMGDNPEVPITRAPEPRQALGMLFSWQDYPSDALSEGMEGSAQVALLIDEKGAAKSCQVLNSTGAPVFEVMGCQVLMQRAKFSPALDGKGKPIRSSYTSPPIQWRFDY